MRVIAGSARSLVLATVEGFDVRPTTDRIKETLFNMLQPHIPGCRFLDIFAGSGAIGIEALSRGASEAVFIEQNRTAVKCIKYNLEHTKLADEAKVIATDFLAGLEQLKLEKKPFDIIFMDPPYDKGLEQRALTALAGSKLITPETLIVVEASMETEFDYLEDLGFEIVKNKEYKTNKHLFIKSRG